MDFYTNVKVYGNNILFRGVKDGKRVKAKIPYQPSLYEVSNSKTKFSSLDGSFLHCISFDGIKEAKEYVKQFEDVSNKKIFGQTSFDYAYIAEKYPNMIEWDIENLSIALIDIEVGSENGFPDPYKATEPITAITIHYMNGETVALGCGNYEVKGNEKYIKCKDEWTLCKEFLRIWNEDMPDVVSGWNIKFFDIPYLVNRFNKVLGEDYTKTLSAWKMISERSVSLMNGEKVTTYQLAGVAILDYLELYKKYGQGNPENFKLDTVASEELNENKLSYEEYGNLHNLYKLDFQKFIEYNIQDTMLIVRLEDKLKLIELALTLAYDTKSNYEDVFMQTRMWDNLIYSYLLNKKIIIPPKEHKEKSEAFEGAYVKEVQAGMHNYVASFDLNSLYPHLMMQYSLSPENLVERSYVEERKQKLLQELKTRKS